MKAEASKNFDLLRQLAGKGDHCAELSLARAYYLGNEPLEGDPDLALDYAHRAAVGGLDFAQYELALMYMGGRGLEPDYDKVVRWLNEASSQGYMPAQTSLGRLLVDGRLVKRDIHRGLRLLLEADKNSSEVANRLLLDMANAFVNEQQSSTIKDPE